MSMQVLSQAQIAILNSFKLETNLAIVQVDHFEAGKITWQQLWSANYERFWQMKCHVDNLYDQACRVDTVPS